MLIKPKNESFYIFPQDIEKTRDNCVGIFKLVDVGGPVRFLPGFIPAPAENLSQFNEGIFKEITDYTDKMSSPTTREGYKKLGIPFRCSIVIHGKPGTGKTCLGVLFGQMMVAKHSATVLRVHGNESLHLIQVAIKQIRQRVKGPIVLLWDEIDEVVTKGEARFMEFLDQFDEDNLFLIGTTNYLDRFPDRFTKRPTRINKIFEVKSLPTEVYLTYIKELVTDWAQDKVHEVAYRCEEAGLTIDQVKHVCIEHYLFQTPLEELVQKTVTLSPAEEK